MPEKPLHFILIILWTLIKVLMLSTTGVFILTNDDSEWFFGIMLADASLGVLSVVGFYMVTFLKKMSLYRITIILFLINTLGLICMLGVYYILYSFSNGLSHIIFAACYLLLHLWVMSFLEKSHRDTVASHLP